MLPATDAHASLVSTPRLVLRNFLGCLALVTGLALHAQSGTPTYTTNRIDINVDGQVDFELVTATSRETSAGPGGFNTYETIESKLVPKGTSRMLVSTSIGFLGNVPALADGDTIGPAPEGQVWSADPAILLNVVEPFGLSGVLAPLRVFSPTTADIHIAVTIGSPESPTYGWIAFARERGHTSPMAWGYSRTPGTPITAGDPATVPSMTLAMQHTTSPSLLRLQWDPGFARIAVEESVGGGAWAPAGTTSAGRLLVNLAPDNEVLRTYRIRYSR